MFKKWQRAGAEARRAIVLDGITLPADMARLWESAKLHGMKVPGIVRWVCQVTQIPKPAVRAELQREPDVAALYRHLKALDPVAAKNIERSNRRRIERALEVCIGSGKPFSDNAPGTGAYPDNGVVQIGLLWPREVLVKRVESRVKAMLQRGFLEEVVQLRKDGAMSQTARQALGYAELNRHLDGRCTLDQAIGDIVIHTRQFAVRQERWFRRDPRIRWVHIEKDPVSEIAPILAEHLR